LTGRVIKWVGVAVLFAAGLLLAGGLAASGVADVTSTVTLPTTTTVSETTTAPATTAVTTVEQTTTRNVTVPTGTTTSTSSTSTTPTWVWVVLAILAAAVIGLLVAVFTRRGVSADERQRRLDAAVANWAAQGWALENQTAGSAILRHGPDLMVVSIDDKGQIHARPLASRDG
jgi:hypothetical protein